MEDGSGIALVFWPNVMSVNPMVLAGPENVTDPAAPEKLTPATVQFQKLTVEQPPSFAARVMVARTVPVPFAPLHTFTVC